MRSSSLVAGLVAMASTASAAIQGFNYGAFFMNQQPKSQVDFEYEFNRAKNLPGTSGWNSARLYTMVQWHTANDVVQAIPAAINTQTKLLLGLWVSGGDQAIENELIALRKAIDSYGESFTRLVVGISVGSEDLYRSINNEVGVDADTLVRYIRRTREFLAGTPLAGTPVGHVDTYNAFLDGRNRKVVDQLDWLGFDGYPYWEKEAANSIENARARFYDGLDKTVALANGRPVWVTETGWPVIGDTVNQAVASAANARTYWREVACSLISRGINVWWYMLQESQWGQANPDFGIYGPGDLGQMQPYFDLSC
ncbi:GPI-anchored cell wall beta-1,3-endoglucanase EglC [Gaeumannomyces tritici R3-111a-1]|uniref:Probable glucan endo-1,3-beta-glucosidase eglC n=1 Tax=Gaeumannomyces tritici (strain R3-111a-1) TaxID=644352 RepID=J3PBS2_GAET3|nr:GPI-anchored cell wall beta-1,3-endoglucanase EglC [Gaeumannomyces tritici R3-111a-1]EJT71689.1 GPI-anchored cell wall beta-1,3-endoglucanase EglC [Gaeumannomyces tritici R3-111a-1]